MRISPCLYGLFLLPWIVTTENEAGGQLGCSILDKALFCIFSCIFFPNFSFLQRDYWLLERRMYGFIWFCLWGMGFISTRSLGLVSLGLHLLLFHSVILILGFSVSFFGFGFYFLFLYPFTQVG